MIRNMGNPDRLLRTVVVAPVLVIAGLLVGGALGIVLFVLAAVMVLTSAMGFCPLYPLVGLNTCRTSQRAGS